MKNLIQTIKGKKRILLNPTREQELEVEYYQQLERIRRIIEEKKTLYYLNQVKFK